MKRLFLILGFIAVLGMGVLAQTNVLSPYQYPQNWWMGISDGDVSGLTSVNISGYTASADAGCALWNGAGNIAGSKVYLTTGVTMGVTSSATQDGTYIWTSAPASLDVISSSASDRWTITFTGITSEIFPGVITSTIVGNGTGDTFEATKYIGIYSITSSQAAVGTITCKYAIPGPASSTYTTFGTIAIGATSGVLTKGTGAQSVLITGVDGSWNATSETVVTKGTETAWTNTSFLRAYLAQITSAGTGLTSAGNITIASSFSTVESYITAGANQSQGTFYSIPNGYTGFIQNYYCSATGATRVSLRVMNPSAPYNDYIRILRTLGAATGGLTLNNLSLPIKCPPQSDVQFYVDGVTASTTSMTAGYQLVLSKNTYSTIF